MIGQFMFRVAGAMSSQTFQTVRQLVPTQSRRWLGTVLVLVGAFLFALEGLNLSMPPSSYYPGTPDASRIWLHWALLVGGAVVACAGAWIVLMDHSRSHRQRERESGRE